MSPTSTRVRSFAARLAQDDAFRALVAKDPRSALAEYDLPDDPGLIPEVVELPSKRELRAAGLARPPRPPEPTPTPPLPPPTLVNVQLFDPE